MSIASNQNPNGDEARKSVEELFKTVITAAGLILTLLWGLTQRPVDPGVLRLVQSASLALVFSIIMALLGLQFIVSALERGQSAITRKPTVAISFLLAWVTFIVGCVILALSIFKVH